MKEIIKKLSNDFALSIDETELLASALLQKPRFALYLQNECSPELERHLRLKFTLLKNGVPIEYLTKQVQFLNYRLKLYPGVFIPRLETEYFVELIRKLIKFKPLKICEIGTGCGAIAIALTESFPDAQIVATDICELAVQNARENILHFHLEERINLLRADFFSPFKSRIFDLIVCNPPYVPRERIKDLPKSVRDFEPRRAIDGGKGGTRFIKKLIDEATTYSRNHPNIALEIDEEQTDELSQILQNKNLPYFFAKDLFNKIRYLFIGEFNKCKVPSYL
ncbi:MAG: peptide chain release factor N(5)-glutamine methyltransferase [candidate division WOR-3 bacterium]